MYLHYSGTKGTGHDQTPKIQQPGSPQITPSNTTLSSPADLAPSTPTSDR
jgi:hypothetical protein